MGWNETECPKCGVCLRTRVRGMGVPGGKEREEGFCPICEELVTAEMTDGFVDVELVPTGEITITNPLTGKPIATTPSGKSLVGVTFKSPQAAEKFIFMHWAKPVLMKDVKA